jgi:hypothetical protein
VQVTLADQQACILRMHTPRSAPRRSNVDNTIIIERGFNGPRLSGNGGYVGGVLADRFMRAFGGDGAVEITLRAPAKATR